MHTIHAKLSLLLASFSITSNLACAGVRVVEDRLQLMVDRSLVSNIDDVRFIQHMPVSGGVALRAEFPWEGSALYISSVFRISNEYRMLYRGSVGLCLAVSQDGVTWGKPNLNLIEYDGSRSNNIVADQDGNPIGMGFSFIDPRPGTPDDERIKILIWRDESRYYHYPLGNRAGAEPLSTTWRKGLRLVVLGSPDGERFRELDLHPNLRSRLPNAFDGGSIFWSEAEGRFVAYFRWWNQDPEPHARLLEDKGIITGRGVRSVFRMTSPDLLRWSEEEPMDLGGAPAEHIYENGTFPYFRNSNLYIALANRFNPGRRALNASEEKSMGIRSYTNAEGRTFTFADDSNDLILMIAKPGEARYQRPFLEAFMRPGLNLGNWTSRNNYAPQHGGILPMGEQTMSFLVTRQHFQAGNHIERMVLRTDGFASWQAPYSGGEFVTTTLQCPGGQLELNFSTSAIGEVQVEIQSADGVPIEGRTLADCPPMIGDRIAGVVRWKSGDSLDALRGQPIRIRMRMVDADLYAFRFAPAPN